MVKFIIHSLNAERNNLPVKKYKFKRGLNIVQSKNTSQGKTTLIGIIDYCLNGQKVFPWTDICNHYTSVSMEIEIKENLFLIRRGLSDDKKVKIFTGKDFKIEIEEDITNFILKEIGIKHHFIFSAGKQVSISIRDYMKLFFMRQLDTKNLEGNVFGFNKVVQAGKIALGLEEKGLVETRLKEVVNEISIKSNYLERLRADIGRDVEAINKEDLSQYEDKLKGINREITDLENKLNEGKNYKIPLLSDIKQKEDFIRESEKNQQKLNDQLLDINILKKELLLDYEFARKSEISLEILNSFPDKKCPECDSDVSSEDEPISCKLCGSKIDDRRQIISNFYRIIKNIERDIDADEKRIQDGLKNLQIEKDSLKKDYDDLMNKLVKIEESLIFRFTNQIKESLNYRDSIVESIKEIKIKLVYKDKILEYEKELDLLTGKKEGLEKELSELQISLKRFDEHKKKVKDLLSLLNMSFKEMTWKEENIFPNIDGKGLGNHGGSDSVRVLSSVLSSLFELSLSDSEVKIPSVLIIDSLRKHEIELEELEALGKRWVEDMKSYPESQVILTGVEIPDYLINEAKANDSYELISEGKFSL